MIVSRWAVRRLRSRICRLMPTMIRPRVMMDFRVVGSFSSLCAELPDLLDPGQDLLPLLLELALGDVLFGEIEHLLDGARDLLDPLLDDQDLVEDHPRLGQGLDDGLLAALDLAGDGDLPLAREQGDVPHLPEVELDRVGRPFQAVEGDQVALPPPGDHLLLAGIEDLDPVAVHRGQEIVEVRLGIQLVGEGLVDLLEQEEALLPALGDELVDLVFLELAFRCHSGLLICHNARICLVMSCF